MSENRKFQIGDYVTKDSGDYRFYGWIVAIVHKSSGEVRYAIEHPEGIMFFMNESQFKLETPYKQSLVGRAIHKRYMDNLRAVLEAGE